MKLNIFCIFITLGINLNLYSQKGLPIQISDSEIRPLTTFQNQRLQDNLEKQLIIKPKWKKLITNKKMAIGVVDLSNPDQVRFASVNGDHMMYAASLPKIAILLAAMDALEKEELEETDAVKNDMKIMISRSNNAAATRMIDRVGYEKIESVMTDPKYMFYDEDHGGGLWVGKRYGGGGDTNREPIKNLSHAASVNQVCRYFYLLSYGKLVSENRSKQMLNIMGNPGLHHKFVNTLDQIAPNAKLFRKSGSWRTYHSDAILVWGKDPSRRYILVALIDDPSGEQIIRNLVRPIEKAIKSKVTSSPVVSN